MSRFICTLWIASAIFNAARYISAAILVHAPCDTETFQSALDSLGPFLPVMATICLAGGTVLLIADAVLEFRSGKKDKE